MIGPCPVLTDWGLTDCHMMPDMLQFHASVVTCWNSLSPSASHTTEEYGASSFRLSEILDHPKSCTAKKNL